LQKADGAIGEPLHIILDVSQYYIAMKRGGGGCSRGSDEDNPFFEMKLRLTKSKGKAM